MCRAGHKTPLTQSLNGICNSVVHTWASLCGQLPHVCQ